MWCTRRVSARAQPGADESSQRVSAAAVGHPRRHDRSRDPQAARGQLLPALALGAAQPVGAGAVSVVADLYLAGVSTRRVDKVVRQLGIQGMSKSQASRLAADLDEIVAGFRTRPLDTGPYPYLMLDALVVKVREGGRSVNACVCHATAITAEG